MIASLWLLAHRRFDIDELEHAHAAWSVSKGLVPYRDFFEHHTPALYVLTAPLFSAASPESGITAATRTLLACRVVMWAIAVIALALTYRLALFTSAAYSRAGAVTVVLLATSFQFLNTAMEFRPDVPALVCVLASLVCLLESNAGATKRRMWWRVGAGVAFSAALLFTQKAVFVAPGLAVAVFQAKSRRALAAFVAGFAAPLLITAGWFAAHGSLAAFLDATIWRNAAINADRRSALPGLLSNTLVNSPLYGAGIAGVVAAIRGRLSGADTVLLTALASLVIGIAAIGRVYDQYYLLMLPLLAVFGGAAVAQWSSGVPPTRRQLPTAIVFVPLALLVIVSAARFEPNDRQLADIGLAMEHVSPDETVLSGIPGAGTFRPHAWYYFFLVGPFASAREYEALRAALDAGQIRPRLVVFDTAVRAMPPRVLQSLHAHYRPLRDDFYIRHD